MHDSQRQAGWNNKRRENMKVIFVRKVHFFCKADDNKATRSIIKILKSDTKTDLKAAGNKLGIQRIL